MGTSGSGGRDYGVIVRSLSPALPLHYTLGFALCRLMQKITHGRLCVVCTGGQTRLFPENRSQGPDGGDLKADIRVKSDTFWIRLCLMGDLGFAEAYMYGEVECDDLVSLFKVR